MLTATAQPNAIRAKRPDTVYVPTRFGSAATEAAKKGADIAHIGIAKKAQGLIGMLNSDVRVGGLSLEDMAGRLLTLIGIYLPQGYFAIRDNKHPYETNGRNAVVWMMTLALTSMTKSENYGVNTLLLNPFMQQKGSAVRTLEFFKRLANMNPLGIRPLCFLNPLFNPIQKLIDWARMDVDYLDIIKAAGISVSESEAKGASEGKKALWASSWLDANKMEKIQHYLQKLRAKESLTGIEPAMIEAIPKFFGRINGFNLLSTAIITGATVYFIGGVAMQIVNKVFTPLDKNQDDPKAPKAPNQNPAWQQFRGLQRGSVYQPYGYNRRFNQFNGYGGLN